ncbi:hypothetical protein AVEN_234313-1 [Araneus ventricosus]|uniref:Uncharacterized protein n=1 Tax=Araneus ventricosus TaxID=182803 RepID=A0A4Y2A8B6_ARAVE|nr:hypothetical protein AVEN_234313-1 [Araneus ventricosus]
MQHLRPTLANHRHCHSSGRDPLLDHLLGEKRPSPFTSLPLGKRINPSETAQNHVSAPAGRPARNIASRTVQSKSGKFLFAVPERSWAKLLSGYEVVFNFKLL